MSRYFGSRRALYVLLGLALPVTLAAQAEKRTVPKAAQRPQRLHERPTESQICKGTWDFAQLTPFERPNALAGKSSFATDDDAEEFAQQRVETSNKDRRDGGAAADLERAYNDFWWDFGKRVAKQTSLVIDPPDGRVPPLTAAAQARFSQRGPQRYDNPEDRPLAERCILGFNSGPPMIPSAYNNNMQFVQTRDYVMIHNEMIHSARVVDLRRPVAPGEGRSPADRRFDRALGGRHARRGHDELPQGGWVPRREREHASRRALQPRRPGYAALSVHRRRSGDVDEAMDSVDPDDAQRSADVRIRLPRRKPCA